MNDLILILIIGTILGSAGLYIKKSKDKGIKCIGCSQCDSCPSKSNNCK